MMHRNKILNNKSKLAALLISSIYITLVIIFSEDTIWRVSLILVLPLACIFYSESIGGYTDIGEYNTSKESPGCLVALMGWILLFVSLFMHYSRFF